LIKYGLPAGICPEGYHAILERTIEDIEHKDDFAFQQNSRMFIKLSTELTPEKLERKMTI
jgi:hypothetical protein